MINFLPEKSTLSVVLHIFGIILILISYVSTIV